MSTSRDVVVTYIRGMADTQSNGTPPSARTTVHRGAKRADYEPEKVMAILRAGSVAHVAVSTGDGPIVLPMVYGIANNQMYLHGALANGLLKAGTSQDICAAVTIVDGLVLAKTPFNHSMNYRSVVVRGTARLVSNEAEILVALRAITDHIVPTWDITRPVSASEIRATRVVALQLDEMSAKIRTGGPINVAEDADENYWCGVVPLVTRFESPIANADSVGEVPAEVRGLVGEDLHSFRGR